MERPYHTIHKNDTQALAHFPTKNGPALLPMVELIEQSKLAVDELIDALGRASIDGGVAAFRPDPRRPAASGEEALLRF